MVGERVRLVGEGVALSSPVPLNGRALGRVRLGSNVWLDAGVQAPIASGRVGRPQAVAALRVDRNVLDGGT